MRNFFHRLGAAFGSAIILLFFSEYFFVNEAPVTELIATLRSNPVLAIPALLTFAGFYTLFAYPFLVILSYFNVRTLSGLLLAGAIFGWATEGLTLPIIYEAMPISFIFPSISWHSLIDVLLGYFLVRIGMRRLGVMGNMAMFMVLGLLWGGWATWYWGAPEGEGMAPLLLDEFALLAIVASGFWIIGMLLADRFGQEEFIASKWELIIVALIYGVMLPIIALPYLPLSALMVPLVGLTIFALWRGRNNVGGQKIYQRLYTSKPSWWTYVTALLTPVTAVLAYAWFVDANVQIPTDAIVQTLLLVGFLWFVFALIAPFMRRNKA